MDLDTIIFILVFLAVVISNIKKIFSEGRKKKDSETPAASEKPDLLQKLVEKVAARIREEVAPQAKKTRTREAAQDRLTGWDAIIGPDDPRDTFVPSDDEEDESEDRDEYIPLELDETGVTEEPAKSLPERRVASPEPESGRIGSVKEMGTYPEAVSPDYSVGELRNAVIWAEILSPPVALKEE